MFFVVFISLFRPISTQWFHLATEVLALDKWLQIFSPLMGYGSPFGGFVSPFVGFVGFAFGFAFFFFGAGITVANGYWCIWLWIHNREKRKIEVLGFREFAYGFTISISPQPYQTPSFSKSSPNRPCMLVSFFSISFFFLFLFFEV